MGKSNNVWLLQGLTALAFEIASWRSAGFNFMLNKRGSQLLNILWMCCMLCKNLMKTNLESFPSACFTGNVTTRQRNLTFLS